MLKKKEGITLDSALVSIMDTMLADERDWARDDTDAWVYGILWGWDDDSYEDLKALHNWTDEECTLNALLHEQLVTRFKENNVKI